MQIETERLRITRFTPDMAQRIHQLSLDADMRRFVPDEVFSTEEEAREALAYLISCYEEKRGPLAYPVLLRDGECIGYVQLVPLEDGTWEIGYHIGREYAGRGYATEAVRAFLPEIMQRLGLRSVRGVCLTENAASMQVLRRCGFAPVFSGMGDYQGQRRDVSVWEFILPHMR